jgi:hypothetical protein
MGAHQRKEEPSDKMIQVCRRRPNLDLETGNLSPVGLWIERIARGNDCEPAITWERRSTWLVLYYATTMRYKALSWPQPLIMKSIMRSRVLGTPGLGSPNDRS